MKLLFYGLISILLNCFLLKTSSEICHVGFKLYIYELPHELMKVGEEARKNQTYHVCKKCIFEQFALEFVVMDYFTQFCGRTYNPDEADYFYLPILKDLDYRISMSSGGKRQSSPTEIALIDVLEKNDFTNWFRVFNVTDQYWRKNNGMDHIIVMAAPVTNLRHQSSMRGFFHYMTQLHTPIFLSVETSRSFGEEYPICAKEKNIIMPYPTIDPDFYSGRWFKPDFPRDKIIFYLGGNHGSCVFIRSALTNLIRNKKYAIQRGQRKREEGLQSGTFCPIPVGDSPSSKRMYDTLNFGCIPVILSDDVLWAYNIQSGGPLDPSLFSIQLPQSIVLKTATFILEKIKDNYDLINYNKTLPSGQSFLDILINVSEEEKLGLNKTYMGGRRLNDIYTRELIDSVQCAERRFLKLNGKKNNEQPPIGSIPEGEVNTLIRVLRKISKKDIKSLQRNVGIFGRHFQFYSMNESLSSDFPLIATKTFPTGGGIKMLEKLLKQRKQKGITLIGEKCQEERYKPGHKYLGKFPCEKK